MSREFNPYEFPPPDSDPNFERRVEVEVVHVERNDQPTDPAADPADPTAEQQELTPEQIAEQQEEQRREERRIAREANPFWQFISGNWLILEGITGTYRYLLVVAATLFFSVVSIFYSFHLSEQYTLKSRDVQLLRERSLEYRKARFNKTSHSAIVKELKARNIPLYDMQEAKTIIEK
ncbi:MAG: hypothetical protein R3Y44_02630 [Rikenellaceae bacterium]